MGLVGGARCLIEGFDLVFRPKLRRFVLIPALGSAVLVVPAVFLFRAAMGWLEAQLPDWLAQYSGMLFFLLGVVAALVLIWLLLLIATLLLGPLLGLLSAQVELLLCGALPVDPRGTAQALAAAALRELRKLGYHLVRLALVFVLTLIPPINVAAPLLWLVFGAWMMAVQFVDLPLENRGLPFRASLQLMRRQPLGALGFGAAAVFVLSIPLLQPITLPAAAAGATLWFLRAGGRVFVGEQPEPGGALGRPEPAD